MPDDKPVERPVIKYPALINLCRALDFIEDELQAQDRCSHGIRPHQCRHDQARA